MSPIRTARRAGIVAAAAAVPTAMAVRFALVYRARAAYPRRNPPTVTPGDLGLAWEDVAIPRPDGAALPGWYMPAGTAPAPGVVLVHGWESARDQALPHALFLHAVGFHVLTFDVRGHGANPPETRPVSAGEFAADAQAAVSAMAARPEVTAIALLGHSMGAAGALVAAAADPVGCPVAAVVAIAAPADPVRMTRQTFRLANLPIPSPIAWPLAWFTTRVVLRPRGHTVPAVSAGRAVREITVPVLLVQGTEDAIVPFGHLERLAAARRAALPGAVTETLAVEGGRHSWLYEFPAFRTGVARFLSTALGGPMTPEEAARAAEAVDAVRPPTVERLGSLDEEPGGFRSILRLVRPGAARPPIDDLQ